MSNRRHLDGAVITARCDSCGGLGGFVVAPMVNSDEWEDCPDCVSYCDDEDCRCWEVDEE